MNKKTNIFGIKRLENAYKIALSVIAILAITSCIFLVKELNYQQNSSRIVNISGRQRMLSQNIVKNVLLLNTHFPEIIKNESREELFKNYSSWVKAHNALQLGDASLDIPPLNLSPTITRYFNEMSPHFLAMSELCKTVLKDSTISENIIKQADIEKLLSSEKHFLELMDKITFEFDAEAKAEVGKLKTYELLFLFTTLVTLLAEGLFIFKPIVNLVNKNISDNTTLNTELMQAIKKDEENNIKLQEEQRNSIKQMIIAEEEERRRIATDLHDSLGQLVVSAKMNLLKLGSNRTNSKIYDHILDTTTLIADELRAISYNLMPATLLEFGIGSCIEQYIFKVQPSSEARIEFIQDNKKNIRIEPIKEIMIYRVSQELLNNAIKHAFATEIVIQLLFHEDFITLMVEDNGKGFDTEQKMVKHQATTDGMGLKNIKTRLESIGAVLNIDSAQEYGTTTIIQIPYNT